MNRPDAEEYTESLGYILAGSWKQVYLAQKLGIPKTLGLSLREWVEDRLGGYIRLTLPERREAVAQLAAEGMSTRQVADVLGVSKSTAAQDVAVQNGTVEPEPQAVNEAAAVQNRTALPKQPKCKHCPIHSCPDTGGK